MNEVWTCKSPYNFADENFATIFSFFVIEGPVEDISVRGATSERKTNLQGFTSQSISTNLKTGYWNPIDENKNNSNIEDIIRNNGIISHNEIKYEIVAFKYYKKDMMKQFLYSIRCAFAHGAFCIHEHDNCKFYYFENFDINGKGLIARMVLKEESLIKIVDKLKIKKENYKQQN